MRLDFLHFNTDPLTHHSTDSYSDLQKDLTWKPRQSFDTCPSFSLVCFFEIEKGLRAVQFTVERSLLFTHSVTFPAQQLVTSRFTTRYIQEKCPLVARNATTTNSQIRDTLHCQSRTKVKMVKWCKTSGLANIPTHYTPL